MSNDALREALKLVNQQAEDDGLWFGAQTAPEAYLQQSLRDLHRKVEALAASKPEPQAQATNEHTEHSEREGLINRLRSLAGEPYRFDGHNEIGVALLQAATLLAADKPAQSGGEQWKCFHCDEVFTTEEDAKLHFGTSERHLPMCSVDAAEYRAMERRMESYNDDDSDMHRQLYRQASEHQTALRRAEEAGYARGLQDATLLAADKPVDMVLYCPKCGTQHIDAIEPAEFEAWEPEGVTQVTEGWDNPPHKSHLCHGCGHIWRPSDTPTNGVERTASGKDADNVPLLAADKISVEVVAKIRKWAYGWAAIPYEDPWKHAAEEILRLLDANHQPQPSALPDGVVKDAELIARAFHDSYERLAPAFGYETRPDTRQFDPVSANGKLMIAVCKEIAAMLKEEKE